MKIPLRVPNPPSKPLIIWDGECHFCRRWIERWREITRDAVDYATSQESAERFPEIPREQFERSVNYIETDGSVFFGAEAVFRSLRCRSSKKWLAWSYEHVPGFAAVSESFYRIIASNLWHRARTVVGRACCFLSFARNRWPNISQLSVGHSPPRDRLLVDLSRALAALAETRT